MITYWRNKKNGKLYTRIGEVEDQTNETIGRHMVVYCLSNSGNKIYVREKKNFEEKFEKYDPKKGLI